MATLKRVLVLNGPNLNMLGVREPEVYGTRTLEDIRQSCVDHAASAGLDIDFRQSNSEGELVTWIQEARSTSDGIIINPAGYTHTSIAIRDALSLTGLPVVELHLTNIHNREPFRSQSHISPVATGVICGFGASGYPMAIDAMGVLLGKRRTG